MAITETGAVLLSGNVAKSRTKKERCPDAEMQRKAEQKKDLCRISDNSRKFGLKKASACLEISEALKGMIPQIREASGQIGGGGWMLKC